MSSRPSAAAASRNTRSLSYQRTDQPRASAAAARTSRYITVSATVCARLSAIRASTVGGSGGHARSAMLAIETIIDQHTQRVLFGELTPADAAASFIAELQQALDDAAI